MMTSEPLLSSIIPFAGSGVAGFFMGMFLRGVLKFLVALHVKSHVLGQYRKRELLFRSHLRDITISSCVGTSCWTP
jgi:hypothetical protein